LSHESFDIIVVGGGHAGCEAALAAARLGARTAILTIRADRIAEMSCNPAIGGLAKGQIVREIDALGGEMARVTDATAIQYRLLNESKGPAVRSPRAQCDRRAYALAMQAVMRRQPGLSIREEVVCEILAAGGRVTGVRCESGNEFAARAVILTTGTFLRGILHVGQRMWPGGRIEEPAAEHLSASLEQLGLRLGRLKTGTPPRVHGRTLDYGLMTEQPSDPRPVRFSFDPAGHACVGAGSTPGSTAPGTRELTLAARGDEELKREAAAMPQMISCWITHTTPAVHEIILENLHRSPMYSGQIKSTGPRYCPSLETKIVRFSDRTSHHVFLEPEGRDTDTVYCNGISTSLPEDVQDRIVHGIPGMERARILRYGYAIEYDFVPPMQTHATLESKIVAGLYLAGQINGTSGYEEAAGQGLIAGVNAARTLAGRPAVVLRRDQAYIGVLIDDLVTKGTEEPYRMFTSLAEYRLMLRHDNADRRLMPLGREIGLVSDAAWRKFDEKERQILAAQALLRRLRRDGRTLENLLRRPEVSWQGLAAEVPELAAVEASAEAGEQVEIEAKYAGYLVRQEAQVDRARRMEDHSIPPDLDYAALPHLRNEAREKLARVRPRSLGQAARIAGIGPADLAVLMIHLAR
jgi:tRNA uridine 5-carboxymethylaminomethyl modification enzyme